MEHVAIPLRELSPRKLVEWVVQKMNDDTLPSAMKAHLESKQITDYASLALWLYRVSNPAIEVVSLFTNNSLIEFLNDIIMSISEGNVLEIFFPSNRTVSLSNTEAKDLLTTYFSDYTKNLYEQYTNFQTLGVYRDFVKIKEHLSELEGSLALIKRLSTSPNREDFRSKLEDAEKTAMRIGKLLEGILNSFFYVVREITIISSKGKIDILKKYKYLKKSSWDWSTKEKVLDEFIKDISQTEVDDSLQILAGVVRNFLDAYLGRKTQESFMTETIRKCRNKSAHSKLELPDLETISRSVSSCIPQLEPMVPRCCHVVRSELSPWLTVLKLRMEDKKELVEVYYPTEHLLKYTCFDKYEDIIRASEDIDLLLALPTGSSSYSQFFLVRYGEVNNYGKVKYQYCFGSQSSLQDLAIKVKLKEIPLLEYTHIQEAV